MLQLAGNYKSVIEYIICLKIYFTTQFQKKPNLIIKYVHFLGNAAGTSSLDAPYWVLW